MKNKLKKSNLWVWIQITTSGHTGRKGISEIDFFSRQTSTNVNITWANAPTVCARTRMEVTCASATKDSSKTPRRNVSVRNPELCYNKKEPSMFGHVST